MSSGYVPYSEVYSSPNPSGAVNDQRDYRRVQGVPTETLDTVRQQQWERYHQPAQPYQPQPQYRQRDRSADDIYPRNQNHRRARDRSPTPSDNSADSYEQQQQQRRPQPRRRASSGASSYFRRVKTDQPQQGQSQQGQQQGQGQSKNKQGMGSSYDGDYRGRIAKNFDASSNGVFAAALGAGIGAVAMRRMTESTKNHFDPNTSDQHWKTALGAIVGAAVANVAENKWAKRVDERGLDDLEKVRDKFGRAMGYDNSGY